MKMRSSFVGVIALACLLLSACGVRADSATGSRFRDKVSLNGAWQAWTQSAGNKLVMPDVSKTKWRQVKTPHGFSGASAGADRVWYRKVVQIPATMSPGRVEAVFNGIGFRSMLYVNGQYIGENSFICVPWASDITKHIRFGQDNEILIGMESARVCATKTGGRPWSLPNVFVSKRGTGLYYEAWIKSHPNVHVSDVYVRPSFRKKKLIAEVEITNKSAVPQQVTLNSAVIADGKNVALAMPSSGVRLKPGETKTVTIEKPWARPHLWFPHDPYLYDFKTVLKVGGRTVDEKLTRFGFREAWVDGTIIRFNGVRAPIRRQTEGLAWIRTDRGSVRHQMKQYKSWGLNCLRWHCVPASPELLEEADKLGMLIWQENEMWLTANYTMSDGYWKAFKELNRRIAKASRNHPSVIAYGIANESVPFGKWDKPAWPPAKHYKDIFRILRDTDKSSFVTMAAGDDSWGLSAFRDWHYPSNLASRWYVPNDFWWLKDNHHAGSSEKYGKRDKPVIVGEDFFNSFRGPNGSYAAFGGEDFYLAGPYYRGNPIIRDNNRIHTDIYRMSNIAVINPADPAVKPYNSRVAEPVKLLAKNYNQNFISGRKVKLHFGLANEVWYPQKLAVNWQLVPSDNPGAPPVLSRTQTYDMPAGEIKYITIEFDAPKAKKRTGYVWRASVSAGKKQWSKSSRKVTVFPYRGITTPWRMRIGVYDPKGTFAKDARKTGVKFKSLKTLDAKSIKRLDLVIVGPGLTDDVEWNSQINRPSLGKFLDRGGNVIVLRQNKTSHIRLRKPGRTTRIFNSNATITFASRTDHPILSGLKSQDLRWWGEDHWVARGMIPTTQGNYRVIAQAGDPLGLRWPALMETFEGKGRVIWCQMLVAEKLRSDPVARKLLQNMLVYLGRRNPTPKRIGLVASTNTRIKTRCDQLGLKYTMPLEIDGLKRLGKYKVLIAQSEDVKSPDMVAALRKYLHNGGTVILRNLTDRNVNLVAALGGPKVAAKAIVPHQGVRVADSNLTSGMGQYDLWWRVGNWDGYGPRADCTRVVAPICSYVLSGIADDDVLVVTPDKWMHVTGKVEDALKKTSVALACMRVGKGRLILDQVNWHLEDAVGVGKNYAVALLSNVGAGFSAFDNRKSAVTGTFKPLSMKPVANHSTHAEIDGTDETKLVNGINNLAQLPLGERVKFKGIPFNISGLAVLRGKHTPNLPNRLDGIECRVKAKALYFMFGCGWSAGVGKTCFSFQINYADGKTAMVPVKYGTHMRNWWFVPLPSKDKNAQVAWVGRNEIQMPICAYMLKWKNPRPKVEIKTIDIVSAKTNNTISFIIGASAQLAK